MKSAILLVLLFLTFSIDANAVLLSEPVTTYARAFEGSSPVWMGCVNCGPITTNQEWEGVAHRFILDQDYLATEITGWFKSPFADESITNPGNGVLRIYNSSFDKEDHGGLVPFGLLAEWNITVPISPRSERFDFFEHDYYSVSGLNLYLPAGEYWIASLSNTIDRGAGGKLGVGKLYGEAVVPEPSSLIILGSGLIFTRLRFKKRKT